MIHLPSSDDTWFHCLWRPPVTRGLLVAARTASGNWRHSGPLMQLVVGLRKLTPDMDWEFAADVAGRNHRFVVVFEAGDEVRARAPAVAKLLADAGFSASPWLATANKPQGHIFLGETQAPQRIRVLRIGGDAPEGLLPATVWVCDADRLQRIPKPSDFAQRAIRAVVEQLDPPDVAAHTVAGAQVRAVRIECGDVTWDPAAQPFRRHVVQLVTSRGGRRIIVNGADVHAAPESDRFRLLWLLAERTLANDWLTIDQACQELFGDQFDRQKLSDKDPDELERWRAKCHVLRARASEIGRLAPGLLRGRKQKTHERAYQLNALVRVLKVDEP